MLRNKITRAVLFNLVAATVVVALFGFYFRKRMPIVHAQSTAVTTQFGNITGYLAGWYFNVVMITTNAPYVDNGCNATTQQYSTLDGVEGNPAFHAALLGALLSNKKVAVAVQGCAYGHPQIIGVMIQP
ncbi:MAG TPA: hypothetical protein VI685_21295 [Candidatus Angelobacter sp.]